MKNLLLVSWITVLAATPALGQNAFTLDQVFSHIDAVSKTFRSTEANIEQTRVTVIVNDREVKSGKFYYMKRSNEPRLKLELTKPQAEYVLVDKGKVQIYTPKIKQLQEASTAGHEGVVQMFLALGFGQTSADLKKSFDVSLAPDEVVDGQKRTVLDLNPKNSATFQSVRVWLNQNQWNAVQIKTVEKSGDYLIVKYSNVKMNGGIPDSRFKLDLPKDVIVVRL